MTQDAKPKIIDVHFQNGAMTVSHSFSLIKAAITFIMPDHHYITFQFPDLEE